MTVDNHAISSSYHDKEHIHQQNPFTMTEGGAVTMTRNIHINKTLLL